MSFDILNNFKIILKAMINPKQNILLPLKIYKKEEERIMYGRENREEQQYYPTGHLLSVHASSVTLHENLNSYPAFLDRIVWPFAI